MSLFSGPEEHAANGPETWVVVKSHPRRWHLATASGDALESFDTRRDAEAGRLTGRVASLYETERQWYEGRSIPGWTPWAKVLERRRGQR